MGPVVERSDLERRHETEYFQRSDTSQDNPTASGQRIPPFVGEEEETQFVTVVLMLAKRKRQSKMKER